MAALVGESGKTTIRRYAIDRMTAEGGKVRVIAPRCVDKTRLTTGTICDALIADCSTETPRRTLEGKARQVGRILTNSSRSGYSHILMIEEAHDLSIQTLKYLKRFWEMEDGFKKLLIMVREVVKMGAPVPFFPQVYCRRQGRCGGCLEPDGGCGPG